MPGLFARRFTAPQGGAKDLYDVQRFVRDRRQHAEPGSVGWLMGTLANVGPCTSLGSYPTVWDMSDGGTLCYKCVCDNIGQIARSTRDGERDGWRVVAHGVNWEDTDLSCDDCNKRIESAYGEPADREETCNAATHDELDSTCGCER